MIVNGIFTLIFDNGRRSHTLQRNAAQPSFDIWYFYNVLSRITGSCHKMPYIPWLCRVEPSRPFYPCFRSYVRLPLPVSRI